MNDLLLFPCNGNAREAAMIVEALNRRGAGWRLLGYLDDDPARKAVQPTVLGGGDAWAGYRGRASLLALPGSPRSFRERRALIERFELTAADSLTLVDPLARVAGDAQLGFNTVVMAGAFVSCGARVGSHCVVLPNSVVSHDASIGDFCLLGSGVSVSGSVSIGAGCYIGSGACLREGVRIGDGALVGLGATVVADVPAGAVVAGNPARALR